MTPQKVTNHIVEDLVVKVKKSQFLRSIEG
jgi:hypothetical protein